MALSCAEGAADWRRHPAASIYGLHCWGLHRWLRAGKRGWACAAEGSQFGPGGPTSRSGSRMAACD